MKYQVYPEYKSIDTVWLNNIPKDWCAKRLRFVVRTNPVKSELKNIDEDELVSFVPMEAVGEFGGITLESEKPLSDVYTGYTYFRDGDVVIAKITPCFENGKGAIAEGLTNGVGFGTTEFHVLRPEAESSMRFMFYLSMSHPFRKIGESEMLGAGGQKRISESFIKDFRLGIPSKNDQEHIAAFLDYKTQQIDQLIEKKKALIEKLNEQRIAVITQAVTKGLDKNAKMKPSGVDWLDDVPAHWEVGGFLKFVEKRTDYRGKTPEKVPDGIFLVTAKNIRNGKINYEVSKEYVREEQYEAIMSRGKPNIGDLLFTTEAPLGEVANVDREDIALAQRIIKFNCETDKLDNYFVRYWMLSSLFQDHLQSLATGSTATGIKASKLFELRCVVPPLDEQHEIVKNLDVITTKFEKKTIKVKNALDLLNEYRSAIITNAVTGKIDVRNIEITKA